jgi:hypothetical protein
LHFTNNVNIKNAKKAGQTTKHSTWEINFEITPKMIRKYLKIVMHVKKSKKVKLAP